MKKLEERLELAKREMINKFLLAEYKYKNNSVTDDNVKWNWNIEKIEAHLIEEFGEYFKLSKKNIMDLKDLCLYNRTTLLIRDEKESIDNMNIWFIIWSMLKLGD